MSWDPYSACKPLPHYRLHCVSQGPHKGTCWVQQYWVGRNRCYGIATGHDRLSMSIRLSWQGGYTSSTLVNGTGNNCYAAAKGVINRRYGYWRLVEELNEENVMWSIIMPPLICIRDFRMFLEQHKRTSD